MRANLPLRQRGCLTADAVVVFFAVALRNGVSLIAFGLAAAGSLLAVRAAEPASIPLPKARNTVQANPCFQVTQVIGYSQVGGPRGGWFVVGGVFESIVPDDHWQLLWHGGAGVDRWRNSDYEGWKSRLISPCPAGSDKPDRVVLSVSGAYGDDEAAWAGAIEATLELIKTKLPSVRQIVLMPVVGGADGKPCPVPPGGKTKGARPSHVRASWQHNHIENSIKSVVAKYDERENRSVRIVRGISPRVRTCADYTDGTGHLTQDGGMAAGRAIAEYFIRRDAHCAEGGHAECGRAAAK